MIVLLIAALSLMGLADAKCAPAVCFAKTSQYQTFQDFIPRRDEISQPSFCTDVNEALSCVSESGQNEECSEEGNSQEMVISAMKSLCQDQEQSIAGLASSPCSGAGYQNQMTMMMQDCRRLFAIDFMANECPATYRGRNCLMRNMRKLCGPGFAKYTNKMWETLEALNCYYQRRMFAQMGHYMSGYLPAINLPMWSGYEEE